MSNPSASKKICGQNECARARWARGMCRPCYDRWYRSQAGRPLPPYDDIRERFDSYVTRTPTCWLWTGSMRSGYGAISYKNKKYPAHRIAWILAYGDIDQSLVIDHQCHVRHCVNPDHLKQVSFKQNSENQGAQERNASGYRGVHWHKASGKWRAVVGHFGKGYWAGAFDTAEDANAAAINKRNELFSNNVLDRG